MASGQVQAGGAILGLALSQVCALPLLAVGGFLFIQGTESAEFAEMDKERAILNMVQTQGKVKIADIALERKLTRDQVRSYVYDLVGKGLFTGYVNWADGVLVSKTASEMKDHQVPRIVAASARSLDKVSSSAPTVAANCLFRNQPRRDR